MGEETGLIVCLEGFKEVEVQEGVSILLDMERSILVASSDALEEVSRLKRELSEANEKNRELTECIENFSNDKVWERVEPYFKLSDGLDDGRSHRLVALDRMLDKFEAACLVVSLEDSLRGDSTVSTHASATLRLFAKKNG